MHLHVHLQLGKDASTVGNALCKNLDQSGGYEAGTVFTFACDTPLTGQYVSLRSVASPSALPALYDDELMTCCQVVKGPHFCWL